ncbi:noroxomaritidine synthase-like [Curcuma longa]|uniref:noroxomaritidine synthase-like n=1 Tax=Curcuma longa TaxID=136217 RepID=UPI003D9EA6BA
MAGGNDGCWFFMALLQVYPEFLISLFCLALFYCYYRFFFGTPSTVPMNWPLAGMFPGLLVNFHRLDNWGKEILRETGCTFSFRGPWFLDLNYIVTCDPANLQHIFNTNFHNYPKGDEFADIFDILGDGIFISDGERWRRQRAKAHALLGQRSFRSFVAAASRDKVEKGLLPLLDEVARRGAAVDLQDVFLRLTFDMTAYLVFGVDPCCLSIDFPTIPFARAIDDAMETVLLRYTVPPAWWKWMRRHRVGAAERKMATAWKEIDRFIAECVAEKRKNSNQTQASTDLLSSYMNDDDQQGTEIDHKFLRDTAVNYMLAGRDTTGAALSWFFWSLSKNPTAEEKILEELKTILAERSSSSSGSAVFEEEELGKMVYLHASLLEALRLFPPVPINQKEAVGPDVLPSGQKVERGAKILVLLYAIGRMDGVWGEDCGKFRPERWISEKGRLRHEPSYKFVPFNSGPRACLGKEVVFTQMKAAAAAVVYRFRLEAVEGHPVEPKLSIILHMKNGFKVRIMRRCASP